MNHLIQEFEAYNRLKNLSEYTIIWYNQKLRDFGSWLDEDDDPRHVSARRIRAYLADKMKEGLQMSTVRTYFEALSGFYSFLVAEEIIETNPMTKVPRPRVPRRIIPPLSRHEVKALLSTFSRRRPVGSRNYMMCLLILDTGLRIGEVAKLRLRDMDFEHRRLKVMGKGNKERWVYVGEKTKSALQRYLEHDRSCLANGHDVLFPSKTGLMLNPNSISRIMLRRFRKASIPRTGLSAHRLRHTFAVNFLRGGGSAFHLQRLLGHATLTMTQRYVKLADEDLAEAHRKASPVDRMMI